MTKTVFISYATEELPLAEMLKKWIKRIDGQIVMCS